MSLNVNKKFFKWLWQRKGISQGEGTSPSDGNAFATGGRTFNALLDAPVALMEQLQAVVLPENAHNTATGLLKKI